MYRRLVFCGVLALSVLGSAYSAQADCSAEVDAAFVKLRQAAAFRMMTKIVNDQGSLSMSVDYVPPDRMHQTVETGTSAGTVELIVIGSDAWSNQGQGWAKVPDKFAKEVSGQMRQSLSGNKSANAAYECLGEKTFEGAKYVAYRTELPPVAAKTGAGAVPGNVQMLYVDKETGLPVRNIVTKPDAPNERLFDGTFQLREGLKIDVPATR